MASEHANCRKCGARLVRADHIKFGKVDDHAESGPGGFAMGADYGWLQNPCPQCGEKEPIAPPSWMKWAMGLFFLAFFGAIIGVMIYLQ